jgi:hypothetical protein
MMITTYCPCSTGRSSLDPAPIPSLACPTRFYQISYHSYLDALFHTCREDLQAFCTKFHVSVPQVQVKPINIPAYTLDQIKHLPSAQQDGELGMAMEVMMDVQIIAGLCPKATIIVYFASFDQKGWIDLLNQVIADWEGSVESPETMRQPARLPRSRVQYR